MPEIRLTYDAASGGWPEASGLRPNEFYTIVLERDDGEFELLLRIDVDEPTAKDDVLILIDETGSEVERLAVKDMHEIEEDVVRLVFTKAKAGVKYSLIRDYGPDEGGGREMLFVKRTFEEIKQLREAD